jgi:hypothetical protein
MSSTFGSRNLNLIKTVQFQLGAAFNQTTPFNSVLYSPPHSHTYKINFEISDPRQHIL